MSQNLYIQKNLSPRSTCEQRDTVTDPFTDLDKDEDQTEENLAPWAQSACAKASVFALV